MKSIFSSLLLSFLFLSLVLPPDSIAFSGTLTFQDSQLSAHIAAIPLDQVLEEFTRVSGVPVRWLNGKGSSVTVSADFTNLPLLIGLQKLLTKQHFMLFYASDTPHAQLTQIWITTTGNTQSLLATPRAEQSEPSYTVDHNDPEEDSPLSGMPPEQLAHVAITEEDPMLREQAVSYLEAYAYEDRRALTALSRLAQHSPHMDVQEKAVEALRTLGL
jgi:hypothetical protein